MITGPITDANLFLSLTKDLQPVWAAEFLGGKKKKPPYRTVQ
uniref:Uncharacterized protein n=1 Tax=Populus trichocarpa TaxID=3694 RepID=A0A3N7FET8_POPTR